MRLNIHRSSQNDCLQFLPTSQTFKATGWLTKDRKCNVYPRHKWEIFKFGKMPPSQTFGIFFHYLVAQYWYRNPRAIRTHPLIKHPTDTVLALSLNLTGNTHFYFKPSLFSEAFAEIAGPSERFIRTGSRLSLNCSFHRLTETPQFVFWWVVI